MHSHVQATSPSCHTIHDGSSAHLWLLRADIAGAADAVCEAEVPARHQGARNPALSLANAHAPAKVVAVHCCEVLQKHKAGDCACNLNGMFDASACPRIQAMRAWCMLRDSSDLCCAQTAS